MRRWLVATVLVLLATSVQSQVSAVGVWSFDEGSGVVAADSSGEDNHGSVDGAIWIAGALGPHALRFSGADIVEMGNQPSLEPTTLSVGACVRSPTGPGRWTYILSEGLEGCICASYALWTDVLGNLGFYTCTGSVASMSPVLLPEEVWDGNWHRIVGTYDGDFVRLYLDGALVGAPVAAVAPNYSMTNSDFRIGHLPGCGLSGFVGDIDEVGVWDGALSDSDIENLDECFKLLSDGFESGDTTAWSFTEP